MIIAPFSVKMHPVIKCPIFVYIKERRYSVGIDIAYVTSNSYLKLLLKIANKPNQHYDFYE